MSRVAVFHNVILAQQAAAFLLERGVPVHVFTVPGDVAMIKQALGKGIHELHAADAAAAARARELLATMDPTANQADEGWEDELRADLSCLPADMDVACATCAHNLRPLFAIRGPEGICPECGTAYDGPERVVQIHGPEALADCYPDHDGSQSFSDASDARIAAATKSTTVPCLRCGYRLNGLPDRGKCPECGLRYDKVRQLRGLHGG